jgi:site-specific recombinase XerD
MDRTRSVVVASSVVTMMHAVRGYFRFAHIDGLVGSDPAVYARLPKIHRDDSRTQGLDRVELIRFLQVAQTMRPWICTKPMESCGGPGQGGRRVPDHHVGGVLWGC